jgi:hypothetical protein
MRGLVIFEIEIDENKLRVTDEYSIYSEEFINIRGYNPEKKSFIFVIRELVKGLPRDKIFEMEVR